MANDITLSDSQAPMLILTAPRKPPALFKLPWAATYTEEIADRVCDEIASGRTISRIAIEEPWCPSVRMLYYWMQDNPDFREAYEVAVRARADMLAHEIVELADYSIDHEQTKIQIDARKWLAGKMNQRIYGEKKVVETNATLDARVSTVHEIDVSHMSLEEIHAAEALMTKLIESPSASRGLAGAEEEGDE